MKTLLAICLLLPSLCYGQTYDSLAYDFINQKINEDNTHHYSLSLFPIEIDSALNDNRDFVFFYLKESDSVATDSVGFGCLMLDSMCGFKDLYCEPFWNQLDYNNSTEWDKDRLPKRQRYIPRRESKRRASSAYSMSRPIFFDNGTRAILFIDMIHAPLVASGYIELYELQRDGTWKMVKQRMLWLS